MNSPARTRNDCPNAPRGAKRAPALRRRDALIGTTLAALGVSACSGVAAPATRRVAQDYAGALRSALEPYADRLPGYHFRATPLGGFGVGSVYLGDVRSNDLSRAEGGWYLGDPDSWLVPDRTEAERRAARERLVAEASFGAFRIEATRRQEIEASLGAAIFVALGVDAGLDFERGAQVSFQASEIRNRRLNWAEFTRAIAAGQVAREVADVVRQDDFVIAAADIVLADYRAEITVDEAVNPSLAAGLRGQTRRYVAKGLLGGSLAVRESTRGHFVAASTEPVVAAVLFKRPPPRPKGSVPGTTDLASWPAVDAQATAIDAVDARVLQGRR